MSECVCEGVGKSANALRTCVGVAGSRLEAALFRRRRRRPPYLRDASPLLYQRRPARISECRPALQVAAARLTSPVDVERTAGQRPGREVLVRSAVI